MEEFYKFKFILGELEADDAPLSLVYHQFGELFVHFNGNSIIQQKVKKRIDFLITESMGLSYMLTPKNAANGFYFSDGDDDDFTDIVGSARRMALKIDPEHTEKINDEMIDFVSKMKTLPEKHKETVLSMSAKNYWTLIGPRHFPALAKLAQTVSNMICSSATSERVWSTFKFIHSRLRNRLTNERINKLVFIYTNCILLDDKDQADYISDEGALITGDDCDESNITLSQAAESSI